MDQNIHELAEMVRLTHSLGIPCLFAQVSEVRGETPFNGEGQNISLSLSNAELAPIVVEAKEEATRLGVELQLTSRFDDAVNEMTKTQSKPDGDKKMQLTNGLDFAIKTCNVPWMFSPRISQNSDGIYPTMVCCHMPNVDLGGNLQNRPEFKDKSIIEIFNSEFYWDIRSRLLDGTLAKEACMGCQYYNSTQWNKRQLQELEDAVSKAERNL
jgi:hypothetical protein